MGIRVGLGFDIHPFASGRALMLGGVRIPHTMGLGGHSDADVLLHAICDAVYGAVGASDIGVHFPSSDAKWKDAKSTLFVEHAVSRLREVGGRVVNLDTVVLAEEPAVAPHFEAIRKSVTRLLGISPDAVNVKASRAEGLGAIGRAEGIAAFAVVLVELPEERHTPRRKTGKAEGTKVEREAPRAKRAGGTAQSRAVTIFIDGASRGNPGPAAWAAVIEAGGATETQGEYLGFATNNQAEYHALIGALEYALASFPEDAHIVVKCDSELVVKQMSGEYRVKDKELRQLHARAKELQAKLEGLSIVHVPREENTAADKHANRLISISI